MAFCYKQLSISSGPQKLCNVKQKYNKNAMSVYELEEVCTFMHDLKKEIIFCVCENNENYTNHNHY